VYPPLFQFMAVVSDYPAMHVIEEPGSVFSLTSS